MLGNPVGLVPRPLGTAFTSRVSVTVNPPLRRKDSRRLVVGREGWVKRGCITLALALALGL